MKVLVATTVHTPLDARIHHRQIRMLRKMGHDVTYVAPWSASGTDRSKVEAGVEPVDVPRSVGRRRLRALRRARTILIDLQREHDILLFHDPELLAVAASHRWRIPLVWDVHEDNAAALIDRPWVPPSVRPFAAGITRRAEAWAEGHLHLMLAEAAYQARFRFVHPVVPNVPWLPDRTPSPASGKRVIYVGRLSRSRGVLDMLEVARRLGSFAEVHLVGEPDSDVRGEVECAHAAGHVLWHGFLPNDQALRQIEGAAVGISLIEPQPNHRLSLQTKVLEYLSRRVPVVVSDLPVTGNFVRRHGVGLVVEYGDVEAATAAVLKLLRENQGSKLGDRGAKLTAMRFNWNLEGERFERILSGWG